MTDGLAGIAVGRAADGVSPVGDGAFDDPPPDGAVDPVDPEVGTEVPVSAP